jgi:glutathione S-transferase
VVTELVVSSMGVNPESVEKSKGCIFKEFDAVAAALDKSGTGYLVGPSFTAADLSFAALAAPALLVQPWEGFAGCVTFTRCSVETYVRANASRVTRGRRVQVSTVAGRG